MVAHRFRHAGLTLTFSFAALPSLAAGQTAQPATPVTATAPAISPELARIIADLGSAEVQKRIDATTRLSNDSSITLPQIESAIKSQPLSPEQRQRLLAAAERRFMAGPRAAVGIGRNGDTQRGATVGTVQPEFPASAVLRSGDRIVAVGDDKVENWEALQAFILLHDPGDDMRIALIRDGATLNATIKLGSFSSLRQPASQSGGAPDARPLARAWELRSRPLLDPSVSEPVASGLPPAAWSLPVYDEASAAAQRTVDPDPSRTTVVAGGESRGGILPPVSQGVTIRVNGRPQILQQPVPAAEAQAQDIQKLVLRQQQLIIGLADLQQRAEDAKTPEVNRRAMRLQIDAAKRELVIIERQLNAVQQMQMQRQIRR